eukprot:SAG31_NODE_590_length_13794_cov_22.123695_1_plen_914_part_00
MPKKKGGGQQVRVSAGRVADTPEPQIATRKDIEVRQQALKEANRQRAAEKIQAHAAEKERDPKSIFETYSLVQGANQTTTDSVADLSPKWCELHPIEFLAFLPQDSVQNFHDVSQSDALLGAANDRDDVLRFANQDCATLLRLPHHEFWSHVVHNRSFQRFKDTYLRHSRRYFDGEWSAVALGESHRRLPPPSDVESELARRVFFILLRMSQPRESSVHFMTEEEFGQLVYEEWLWDVPALLDLAVIYGRANEELVGQIVGRIFQLQPSYAQDLSSAGELVGVRLQEVCKMIRANMGAVGTVSDGMLFVLDAAHTLHALLAVQPTCASLLVPCEGVNAGDSPLLRQLVNVFELAGEVSTNQAGTPSAQLSAAVQPVLVQLFDVLMRPALLEPGAGKRSFEVLTTMHQWVENTSSDASSAPDSVCAAPALLVEWAEQYGAMAALSRLHLAGQLDEPQCHELAGILLGRAFTVTESVPASSTDSTALGAGGTQDADPNIAMVKEFAGVEHLSDRFVAECLDSYGGSVEETVQAMVMENLPPHLAAKITSGAAAAMDEPEPELGSSAGGAAVGREHRNIFDGDKYDIFNPDAAAVYAKARKQGKRATAEARDVLDARTAEETARLKEGAKLAVLRQHEEAEQRAILEKIHKAERARLHAQAQGQTNASDEAEYMNKSASDLNDMFAEIASSVTDLGDDNDGYLTKDRVYDAERAYDEMRKRDDELTGVALARQSSEIQSIMYDDEYDDALDEFDNVDMDGGMSGLEQLAVSLQQAGKDGSKRLAELKAEIARDNALLNRTTESEEAKLLETDRPKAFNMKDGGDSAMHRGGKGGKNGNSNRQQGKGSRSTGGKKGAARKEGGGGDGSGRSGHAGGKGKGSKGNGQSTAPKNARRKEQNKATRANHNRKQASARKGA